MTTMAQHIQEKDSGGMRFFAARTGARDVVSIEGSLLGGGNMLPRSKRVAASLAAELFDAGTQKRNKKEIREMLSSRGISLSFSSSGDRVYFNASCLPEDLATTLGIIAECLSQPKFPASELALAQKRAVAEFKEEKTDTLSQGSQSLTRLLYDPSHVNFVDTTTVRAKNVASITRKELLSFTKAFRKEGLVLVVTGDIEPVGVIRVAEKAFNVLESGEAPSSLLTKINTKKIISSETIISIPHKTSIDTFLGVPVPLTINDPQYQAFIMLCDMLGGGGFTNHLMQTVRERDGLCYVIRATPAGFADAAQGFLRVYATFSPDRYEYSVNKLREEINIFFKDGITQEKVAGRKFEKKSHYLIGLSTSRGLAGMLHKIGIEKKPLSYIDEYSEIIESLTVQDIREATALVQLDKLSLAAAGTFVK